MVYTTESQYFLDKHWSLETPIISLNQTKTQHCSKKWVFEKEFSLFLIQYDFLFFKSHFNYTSVLNSFPQDA